MSNDTNMGTDDQTPGPAALDHLVFAVPDLDAALVEMAERTGVEPALGGSHPGRGTRNALIGLTWRGDTRCYLEILGPDPQQPDVPPADSMLGLGDLGADFSPRMHAWAVRPAHLEPAVARATAMGADIGEPIDASRVTPAGTALSWTMAVPRPLGLGGVQPFLVDWRGGPHPSDDPLPVLDLLELRLVHPDPAYASRVLTALGVHTEVEAGEDATLIATLQTPRGTVVLGGTPETS